MKMTTLIGVNPDCNHPTESRQKVQTFYYYNLSPYNKMSAMCPVAWRNGIFSTNSRPENCLLKFTTKFQSENRPTVLAKTAC